MLLQSFQREGVAMRVGPMSTHVAGSASRVFAALRDGFERAALLGPTVMTVTVSNACPGGQAPEP